jgi:hypothetical protein
VLNVSDKAFGRTVPCPVCKQPITVPNKPAAPAAAEPSSAVGPACRAGLPGRDEPAVKSSVPAGAATNAKSRPAGGTYTAAATQAAESRPAGGTHNEIYGEAPHRRAVPWWLLVLAAVVSLAVIGVAAFYWMEGSGLSKASALMAEGDFRGAASVLRPLQGKTMFHGRETDYLLAVAVLRQYAAAPDARNLPDNFTAEPVDRLRLVLQAVPKWRDRARSDHLTDLITTIPEKAPDELARAALLADILQKKLELADERALAKQLLQRLKARIEANRDLDGIHIAAVAKILGLDPTIQDDLLAALLPEADDNPQRLALLRRLATEDRTLAKTWSEGMSERAGRLWKAGRQLPGDAMLAAADAVCPERHEACAQQRVAWLKNRLADKDYTSVAKGLQAVNLDDFPPALRGELAGICFQAAQGLVKADQAAAQRALDKAFQLSPSDAGTEANSLLWIDLHPEQTDQKVTHCKDFLTAYPKADRALDVRKTLWEVALRWAAGKREEAIELGQWLLENTPDSPLRQEIDKKIAAWQAGPAGAQPAAAPAVDPAVAAKQAELDTKLEEHKAKVEDTLGVMNATLDKNIWIIEVGDGCSASAFSPKQMKLFKDWVRKGGIVWADNSVLRLFGIGLMPLQEGQGLECAVAGKHTIVEGVKTVRLKDVSRATHTLTRGGRASDPNTGEPIPLLKLKKATGSEWNEVAAGTVVWSLVPYGSGWVTNRKEVDLKQNDGAAFWLRFCQFCLRELSGEAASAAPATPDKTAPGPTPAGAGQLTGVWKGEATAASFRLTDDGKKVTVELAASEVIKSVTGTLSREAGEADPRTLTGELKVVFHADPTRTFIVKAAVTIQQGDNSLAMVFENWPIFAHNGKFKRMGTQRDTWNRADSS